jgi:zinc protease
MSAALALSSSAGVRADAPPLDGTLSGGGAYIVRPLAGAPVAAISLWYRASSSGFDATPVPGLGRLAATAVAASQPVTGTPLGTFVNRLGGRMSISAYPESVAISLLVPADRAALAIRALTRSFFAPVLTDAGLDDARRAVAEEAAIRALSPDSTISDQLYAQLFAAGPDQAPPFPAPAAVGNVPMERVRAYAERAFRPANAVLVLTGAVDPGLVASALTGREGAAPGTESPLPEPTLVPSPLSTRGAESGFGLAWTGPPIADEAAATAFDFIADELFSDGGAVQRAAAAAGTTLDGTFVTYHNPGVFIVTATGGDVAAARAALTASLAEIRKPLAPAVFERARRAFVYRLLSHAQTPDLIADNYGWYTVEGAAAYTPGEGGAGGRYLKAVAALTPAFVAATAATYLDRPGASVTVASVTDPLPAPPSAAPSAMPSPAPSPTPTVPGTHAK